MLPPGNTRLFIIAFVWTSPQPEPPLVWAGIYNPPPPPPAPNAGVSVNKLLAKVGSARNKPDKQTLVLPRGVQDMLTVRDGHVPGRAHTRVCVCVCVCSIVCSYG